jgi:NitT/TauT family transport system permease protein
MSQQGIEMAARIPSAMRAAAAAPAPPKRAVARNGNWRDAIAIVSLPIAAVIALALHQLLPDRALSPTTHAYRNLLLTAMFVGLAGSIAQVFSPALRRWIRQTTPLLAAAVLILAAWELIVLKLALLPIIYFPAPEMILQTLIEDRAQLFDSTWHSLLLLLLGYAAGTLSGLTSGITIGWSSRARYWGMPLLKIIGPIPATAWIPLALIIFPQSNLSGMALIALAVWFPVTMLTASGVSNTRASYLDVARTLGASRAYLIFRVAIPAAMPSIFVGLFMGLGSSFLTLLVAESTGVRSGLGWYIDWARNYSDYAKVFAALVIMAVFFSTIMTVLFKARDRVLVWQKGTIKW